MQTHKLHFKISETLSIDFVTRYVLFGKKKKICKINCVHWIRDLQIHMGWLTLFYDYSRFFFWRESTFPGFRKYVHCSIFFVVSKCRPNAERGKEAKKIDYLTRVFMYWMDLIEQTVRPLNKRREKNRSHILKMVDFHRI